MFISGVNDTGNKFIAGNVVTGDNCSLVSLSPAINLWPVSLSPAIIVHRCRWHRWEIYRRYQRHRRSQKSVTRIIPGVVDTGEQLIAGVVDTGEKHSFGNISANFWKNSKRLQWNTWGPRGQWFMKKTWSRKSRVRFPLMQKFLKVCVSCTLYSSHRFFPTSKSLTDTKRTENLPSLFHLRRTSYVPTYSSIYCIRTNVPKYQR